MSDCMVPCFKCGKALDRVFEYELQPSDGTSFATYGHYGSTFWDSFNGEEIVVIICDDCLNAHSNRIARHKRWVAVTCRDYSTKSSSLQVGRYWVEREPVPYFPGHSDEDGVSIDPEEIGEEKVSGFTVEWVANWRDLKDYLQREADADEERRGLT